MPGYSICPKLFRKGTSCFESGPNCFGKVQIILFRFKLADFSRLKWFGPNQNEFQNDCYSTKIIWKVQNPFGPIERKGKSQCLVLL